MNKLLVKTNISVSSTSLILSSFKQFNTKLNNIIIATFLVGELENGRDGKLLRPESM